MPLINLAQAEVFVDGLDHPEGIALGPDGRIYAGGEQGQVYRVDRMTRQVEQFATTVGLNLGLAHDADCNTYMCNPGARAVQKITPEGAVSVYSTGDGDRRMINPNYPAFDPQGNLFVCDSGGWKKDNGCVWSIAPDGRATVIDTVCAQFPNGCAVSPNGRYLYMALSLNEPRVTRFRIEAGKKAGPVEVVAQLPRTVPDGLAFCADGSLLVSCYRPDAIYCIMPSGDIAVVMEDYEGTLLGAPTNVCFAGTDLSILMWANLGRWHLGMNAHTGLRGAGVFYPKL
ncbi:MAG: SMP-30/gluconolactonase/LRE family protein [Chloroflexi bacterium]|nr:SMP-30/gluconolactonase/LRE family protein [Chloroflexota bacterium]